MAKYREAIFTAKFESGVLVLNDKSFDSPSAAAVATTKWSVNGWNFRRARLPGYHHWRVIASFRS